MLTSEDRLQSDCFLWFHNSYPSLRGLLFHVPNGGSRDAREGNKFKAMGVTPGIPDLILLLPGGGGRIVGIEFKTETGALSPVQKTLHTTWRGVGCNVEVVRGVEVFKELIIIHCGAPANATNQQE